MARSSTTRKAQRGMRGDGGLRPGRGLRATAAAAVIVLSALLLTSPAPQRATAQTATFNYGEALQKAVWFYEAQIAGPKPSWSRVTWRGDSAMTDGSDVGRDLTGGWFDAGDHIKFGFAMASSATMLAWGGVEYRDAYQQSGQLPHLLNNLRVANDFFIKAHTAPDELWGQVGTEGPDHSFWGPAEIMQMPRASARIFAGCGGSDLAAETAAAMAASAVVFRPVDPGYADTLVAHARQLFDFAERTPGTFYVDCIGAAQCCYNSRFGTPADEVAWAAVWLHRATGEQVFLDRARQLYPTMCKEQGTQTPCFTWAQSWNDKHFGVYVLMAKLTNEAQFRTDTQRWLDHWIDGAGRRTPGGLMFVDGFGALRYATNTAFISLVYADYLGASNPLYARYHGFAKRQVDYALGNNPMRRSLVVGFGTNPPINPHHRTAHGSWVNGGPTGVPLNNRHVLYGALVGGPTSQDDNSYVDDRGNFRSNEVATDFNAGFAGALARLYREYGGQPLANFPPVETPDGDEIFVEAGINVSGTNFTEVRAFVVNRSAWPARMLDAGTFRYFFTLEPGVTPGQITVNSNFSQCGSGSASGPTQFSGNVYFVTVNCIGTRIYPGGQSEHRREVQFRISSSGAWNPTNDHSFADIAGATGGQVVPTRRIVLYSNGTRIWGDEPGPAAPDFTLAASPASVSVNRGASVTSTVNITRTGGFTGAVALTASGLPAGVSAAFNPASAAGASSTVTFTASATATLGAATVNITGTGGGLTRSVPVSLTVNQPQTPNFTLAAAPASLTITRGSSGTSTINITRTGGFTGSVALSASGLPSGVTASFNPASAAGTSSTLTLSASATATLGAATVTVTGTGGGLTRTTNINLSVNQTATPDFSLSANPAGVTVNRGASSTSTVNITRTGGFTSAVALTASGLPAGVAATFSPASATGASGTVTFTASATATLGAATVTVTGTGGGLTRTTSVALTVSGGGTGGVTVTPVVSASGPWFNEQQIRLANTSGLTELTITIVVQRTAGVSFNGQYNTVGAQITQSNSSTAAAVTYRYTLGAGQTLPPGTNWTFAAQTSGTGTIHPTAGDTYTVTYTTGGVNFTQSGHF